MAGLQPKRVSKQKEKNSVEPIGCDRTYYYFLPFIEASKIDL
jgi:hypothetical protein